MLICGPITDLQGPRIPRSALLLGVLALFQGTCAYAQASGKGGDIRDLRVEVCNGNKISSETLDFKGADSLENCLELGLERHHKRPAPKFAVAIAETQHGQALSAYWSQLTLQGNASLRSFNPNHLFPRQNLTLPETPLIAEQTMTFPAGAYCYAGQPIKSSATSCAILTGVAGRDIQSRSGLGRDTAELMVAMGDPTQ